MDEIKARFWMVFHSRKAVLDFALEVLWDSITMQRSVVRAVETLQLALCRTENDRQLKLNFKYGNRTLRPKFRMRFQDEHAA